MLKGNGLWQQGWNPKQGDSGPRRQRQMSDKCPNRHFAQNTGKDQQSNILPINSVFIVSTCKAYMIHIALYHYQHWKPTSQAWLHAILDNASSRALLSPPHPLTGYNLEVTSKWPRSDLEVTSKWPHSSFRETLRSVAPPAHLCVERLAPGAHRPISPAGAAQEPALHLLRSLFQSGMAKKLTASVTWSHQTMCWRWWSAKGAAGEPWTRQSRAGRGSGERQDEGGCGGRGAGSRWWSRPWCGVVLVVWNLVWGNRSRPLVTTGNMWDPALSRPAHQVE